MDLSKGPLNGYGGAPSVLILESPRKLTASMLGTASNYRQNQTITKVCLYHGVMINKSCTPIPHSMISDVDLHAASADRQNEQGRVQDLVFLIKNLYYEDITINIPNTSDLEAQGIKVYLNQNKCKWKILQNIGNFGIALTRIKDLEQNWISFKNTIIKAAKFQYRELDYTLENTDLSKTQWPDGIHGQMISNLGKNGKERLLDIFNDNWKT
ncbi:hypothetical protein LAZ67_8001212 [Cordylochernes scorpioides]|uniref:Uncharacterized protein n=1 Tax=Cordylochernes scorpioides TaxID=51811 RepID=A0ABY6KRZ4_9ARAC|nr:hypothetical protein LAZ67_8001212 [Cordylochernes scorpioides]